MDAVDIGTFVNAGSTTLVTIDSVDPIFVEFSMTEQEYLEFMATRSGDENSGLNLKLRLADGKEYNQVGSVVQAARTLDPSTGKLILKASFPNPDHLLLPNMFATVISPGEKLTDAFWYLQKLFYKLWIKTLSMSSVKMEQYLKRLLNLVALTGAFTNR